MQYNPDFFFAAEEYIQTNTGNIVARSALLCKPQSVELPNGKCIVEKEVVIRGDLAAVQINKYSHIGASTILRPSYLATLAPSSSLASSSAAAAPVAAASTAQVFRFIPLTIGPFCSIGINCTIEAAAIGTGCTIGDNCILSKRCILKDFVTVLPSTVVPPDMVCPPFSILKGVPARIVGEAPESTSTIAPSAAIARYRNWKPRVAAAAAAAAAVISSSLPPPPPLASASDASDAGDAVGIEDDE